MTELVGARLAFSYGWDEGEDHWGDGASQNFRQLDTTIGLSIVSDALTAPPFAPDDGAAYLVQATATGAWAGHEGEIAAYQTGTWYFYPVVKGLRALIVNHSKFYYYDGAAWSLEADYSLLPSEVQNIPMAFPFVGKPGDGITVVVPILQATTLPANFSGSQGYSSTNADVGADAVFSISYVHSGTTTAIGTVTFTSSGHTPTFSTQAQVDLVAGNVLILTAPSPQSATLSDVGITLMTKKV